MAANQGVKAEEVESFRDIYGDPPEDEDDELIFQSPSKKDTVSEEQIRSDLPIKSPGLSKDISKKELINMLVEDL